MEDNIRTEVINAIIDGQSDYAGELIEAHKPEYLYKYRSGKEYDFDTLVGLSDCRPAERN